MRGADQVAAGADQAMHLLEPAQAERGREVRPDRDRAGEVERAVGELQRRRVGAEEEVDARVGALSPLDRRPVGVAAVPLHLGVGGGEHPHQAPGGAAEVEARGR